MKPSSIDIQLLLGFEALMNERQVTRAAQVMGLSQPAMSHLLSRLRMKFQDQILSKTARGMEPTSLALELIEPVRNALRQIEGLFDNRNIFAPAESKHSFNIRMGDMNEFLFLPHILLAMQEESPNITIKVNHLSPMETIKALDNGEIDFAISTKLKHPKSIQSIDLLEDKMVCIMNKKHPLANEELQVNNFTNLRHINIVQSVIDTRFIDEDLSNLQLERNVVLNIPHWLAAPAIVEHTNLVAAISDRMAQQLKSKYQFVIKSLPVGESKFHWKLYWHKRYDSDPPQKWLRELVRKVCSTL